MASEGDATLSQANKVGQRHWTLDDINWQAFDRSKVDPELVKMVKAAALVEYNAPDYVEYLCNVFQGYPDVQETIRDWGREEEQHGEALARWARLADPQFDFDEAVRRFRAGYRIPVDSTESVRGSYAGEMVARCIVEVGTSSFYSAIRDNTEEPCLKQIVSNMATDEFAHYALFYETFLKFEESGPSRLGRLRIALGRINEADDDELSYAYYAANYNLYAGTPYERETFANAYQRRALGVYQRRHVDRLVRMVARASGFKPRSRLMDRVVDIAWRVIGWKQRRLSSNAI